MGGEHGVFSSPESGPAQFEKAFFIDGNPVPHQFMGPMYVSDPKAAGAGPEIAAPGMAKVGLIPGDSVFYWDGAYWKKDTTGMTATVIDSPSGKWDLGHFATFDAELEVVWGGPPDDDPFGPPPPGHDLVPNTSAVTVGELEIGDHFVGNTGITWEVTGGDSVTVNAVNVAAPDSATSYSADEIPAEVPAYKVSPPPLNPDYLDLEPEPTGEFGETVYTEHDAQLVKALKDAQDAGDAASYDQIESTIFDKLEPDVEGDEDDLGDAFVQYVGDVAEQFGLGPFEPGGPEPEPGPPTVEPEGQFPVSQAVVGDWIVSQVSGKKWKITEDLGDHWSVVWEHDGTTAGTVSKQNVAMYALKPPTTKSIVDLQPPEASPMKPYSPKSKTGGGYHFKDLDQLLPGHLFLDKTGTLYIVTSKSADGYYVRFKEAAGRGRSTRRQPGRGSSCPQPDADLRQAHRAAEEGHP